MSSDSELMHEIFETDRQWGAPGVFFASRKPLLHSMLVSCGYETRTSPSYDFNGLTRGASEFAVFQYTIAGEGSLDYEGRTFKMKPGDAMLVHIPHDHRYYLASDSKSWRHLFVTVAGMETVRLMREAETLYGPVIHLEPDSSLVKLSLDMIAVL